jgi:hypothetical protein
LLLSQADKMFPKLDAWQAKTKAELEAAGKQ